MIVVTGATGNVGRPLVRALVAAGVQVTAISRRISAQDVPDGAQYHQADLIQPANLTPAVEGAEALFLLTSGDFMAAGADLGAALDAVRNGGVRRVVLLSSQGVRTGNHPPLLENAVKQSGLEWTMLRPGNFATNAFQWAETVRAQRTIAAPFGEVALPTIDPADIAEVAARTLRETGHDGHTYELTGPAPVSPRQQAAAIGAALGEPVRFVEQTHAEARAEMVRFMPESIVDATLDMLAAPGDLQRVSPDVQQVLGRPAHTFEEWAARNIAVFK